MSTQVFELPDVIASLPATGFELSPAAEGEAAEILSAPPEAILQRFLRDQESEAVLLAARKIIAAFLADTRGTRAGAEAGAGGDADDDGDADADADVIAARVRTVREELAATVRPLAEAGADAHQSVLRQRAPLALAAGCWLDMVSQPATQPSVIVNHLFRHHYRLKGEGFPQRSLHHRRRRALEDSGAYLPEIDANDFLRKVEVRPLTALHACFYVALSRLPASFLPEVAGVHYAFFALGLDDLLCGTPALLPEPALREALAEYLELTRLGPDGPSQRRRLRRAVQLVLTLEREHAAMLAKLAAWQASLPLDSQVAAIVARHAPFAGRQHRNVRVHGRLLSETFADPDLDVAAFVEELRASRQLRPLRTGGCRLLNAIRFGGPMFGIFDEREAATLKAWVAAVQAGAPPEVELPVNRVGDEQAAQWLAAVTASEPGDVRFAEAAPRDDRELFYRLVNIERFPNTLPLARQRAAAGFADGEILFTHGAAGRYTDASYFDYSPEALLARIDSIYWDKLVNPYRPLEEIPDREDVVFGQSTFALGSLVDGAWAHRIGNLGRFRRRSDALLFAIYADEMGQGDLAKNHVTLIHQVLASLSIRLPHIRDAAFQEQGELPDNYYGFSVHQMCMSFFPDSFYNEILGYNLAVEMFGLGELRMHEIQKLRSHGFDTSYEEVHLSIDNLSAGHSRQAAEVIVSFLDGVERDLGSAAVQDEWRRVWRGYAAFAYFAEHQLLKTLSTEDATGGMDAADAAARAAGAEAGAGQPAQQDLVELVI